VAQSPAQATAARPAAAQAHAAPARPHLSYDSVTPRWRSRVRYWIADPTGVPHVVAGSGATQWYWGNSYDITTANPDFQTPSPGPPPPGRQRRAAAVCHWRHRPTLARPNAPSA